MNPRKVRGVSERPVTQCNSVLRGRFVRFSRGLLASCFSFIVFFYLFSFVQMLDKFISGVLELQKL